MTSPVFKTLTFEEALSYVTLSTGNGAFALVFMAVFALRMVGVHQTGLIPDRVEFVTIGTGGVFGALPCHQLAILIHMVTCGTVFQSRHFIMSIMVEHGHGTLQAPKGIDLEHGVLVLGTCRKHIQKDPKNNGKRN